MKRIIINIIIAGALLISATNVYADGNKDKKVSSKKSEKSEKRLDAEMKIEKWMTELELFTSGKEYFTEEALQLEDWMTVDFDTTSAEGFVEEEQVLEDWMTSAFDLGGEAEDFEEELSLEPWMLKLQ